MSRSSITTSIRALVAAGVLLAAGVVSAFAQARDLIPERALLNIVSVPAAPIGSFNLSSPWVGRPGRPVSGETALLARVETPAPPAQTPSRDVAPINGVRALLGRSEPVETSATALSAESE